MYNLHVCWFSAQKLAKVWGSVRADLALQLCFTFHYPSVHTLIVQLQSAAQAKVSFLKKIIDMVDAFPFKSNIIYSLEFQG